MPNKKISELTALGILSATDEFPVAKAGATYRASIQQVLQFVLNANVFASLSHTHTLADLQQSSATAGQVARWSGTAWAPHTLVPADIGAANASHTHDASEIVSGVLATVRGGTGLSSFVANRWLWASSSSALSTGGTHWTDGTSVNLGSTTALSVERLRITGGEIPNSINIDEVRIGGGVVRAYSFTAVGARSNDPAMHIPGGIYYRTGSGFYVCDGSSWSPLTASPSFSGLTANRLVWANSTTSISTTGTNWTDGDKLSIGSTVSLTLNDRLVVVGGAAANPGQFSDDRVSISGGSIGLSKLINFKFDDSINNFVSGLQWQTSSLNTAAKFIWDKDSSSFIFKVYGAAAEVTPIVAFSTSSGSAVQIEPDNSRAVSILSTTYSDGQLIIGGSTIPSSVNSSEVRIGNGILCTGKYVVTGVGTSLPTTNIAGGLFYKTGIDGGLYVCTGTTWQLSYVEFEITDTVNFTSFPNTYIKTYSIAGPPSGTGMKFVVSNLMAFACETSPSLNTVFYGGLKANAIKANTVIVEHSLGSSLLSLDVADNSGSYFVNFKSYRSGWSISMSFMSVVMPTTVSSDTYVQFYFPIRPGIANSDPSVTAEGALYWNTETKRLRVYNGSSWVDVGSSGGGGIGDTIDTGNLRSQINRSNTLPTTGGSPSWYNKLASVAIIDEEDADQSRGLNIFTKDGIPNITIGRFESTGSLYAPGTTVDNTTVGRVVFVGAHNNLYSDFARITAVKRGSANNICYGNIEFGVRNTNGTYINPVVINSSGHLRVSTGTSPTSTPGSDTVIIGNGTCWVGNILRVEGQSGYIEAANRSDSNGTTLKINSSSYKYAQIQFLWDNSQRAAVEVDNTNGQMGIIGGWNSGDYIRIRVGSGLPDILRVYSDRLVVGENIDAALIIKSRSNLPTSPEVGMLVNHNNQLKFYNGSTWVTIA